MVADIPNDGYFLTGQELAAIRKREYHYNAWSDTLLDAYMQPFWRHVVSYVPTHVAPSTLSACGLLCNITATCITVYFAPGFTEPLPSWVSVVNAVSIFMYQTFDGIDGKQCLRTQESEVEEYADHAADSVSVVLNAVLLGAALQLGDSPILLGANFFFALSAFFAVHWAGHRTRSMVFGRVDVTEAQWSMIAIHLATAVGGPSFWETALVEPPLITLKYLVCGGSILALFSASVGNLTVALGLRETPLEANGIRIPRSHFSPWPAATYLTVMTSFLLCSQSGLLTLLPVPTMLVAGLTLGKAGARLILHKLATKGGNVFDPTAASPLALYAIKQWTAQPESWSLAAWTLVGALVVDVAIFHAHAFSDLKRARGINIFRMKETPDGSKMKAKEFYVAGGNITAVQEAWKEFESDKAKFAVIYPDSR